MSAARGRRPSRVIATLGAAGLAAALLAANSSAAISPSTFDAENGDVSTTAAGLTDWDDLSLNNDFTTKLASGQYRYKDDVPSGQNDDSFTQGTSENTEPPVPESGSVPPNKSDLTRFFIGTEKAGADDKPFLYLGWQRELNPKGTTNMDFEFNQSDAISANGITPVRTHGDVLIEYKLAKGGTVPEIYVYKWNDGSTAVDPDYPGCEAGSFPCWSVRKDLTSVGDAEGSVNLTTITNSILKEGSADAFTFGEASIDLLGAGLFTAGECTTFGSAYLKSRSSDSFTAALKDYIAPMQLDLSNCGQFTVIKQTVGDVAGDFDFTVSPAAGSAAADGTGGAVSSGTLSDGEEFTAYNVQPGDYDVTETVPAGWNLDGVVCVGASATGITDGVTIPITADSDVTCTFTNSLEEGAIKVTKVVAGTSTTLEGAAFALDEDGDPATTDDQTSIPAVAGQSGVFCVENLTFGDYTVVETTVPSGYTGGTPQSVTVDTEGTCASGAETLTFENKKNPSISTVPKLLPNDRATLSNGFGTLTGDLVFKLFANATCTGDPIYTEPTITVNGNGPYDTTNNSVYITADGTYSWLVTYSGNASNNEAVSTCTAEQQAIDFTPLAGS